MYLTGSKTYNLDAKARLMLPADFRREFSDKVCLVPLPEALYGFSPEGHKNWIMSFFPEGFNPRSRRDRDLRRHLTSSTVTLDIDRSGRISLSKISQEVREKLGIKHEVAVVGNDDHFEIWDAQRWEQECSEFSNEDLDSLMFDE